MLWKILPLLFFHSCVWSHFLLPVVWKFLLSRLPDETIYCSKAMPSAFCSSSYGQSSSSVPLHIAHFQTCFFCSFLFWNAPWRKDASRKPCVTFPKATNTVFGVKNVGMRLAALLLAVASIVRNTSVFIWEDHNCSHMVPAFPIVLLHNKERGDSFHEGKENSTVA